MDCMNAYCVLVAVHHALHIGGTLKSFLDQLHCSNVIDGFVIGIGPNLISKILFQKTRKLQTSYQTRMMWFCTNSRKQLRSHFVFLIHFNLFIYITYSEMYN